MEENKIENFRVNSTWHSGLKQQPIDIAEAGDMVQLQEWTSKRIDTLSDISINKIIPSQPTVTDHNCNVWYKWPTYWEGKFKYRVGS